MKIKLYLTFLYLLFAAPTLKAQDLEIYSMQFMEHNDSAGFVSLSENYQLSNHPDSLAVTDFSEEEYEESQGTDFILKSKFRKQFLAGTRISETDKVFIYSYSKNVLISFPVSNLNVIACLNMYADRGPYSQSDYMIGFEIHKKYLNGFEQYFTTTLISIGKVSPFVLNQMKPVAWKKIDAEKFPANANDTTKNIALERFHYNYPDDYTKGETYIYEANNLQYFVQNILWKKEDNRLIARYLYVMNKKTKETVRSAVYVDHESETPAPLNYVESEYVEQWTGKLFKNKPPVILGFQYVAFGCPGITFLNPTEKDIYIYCDNRH